MWDYKVCNSHAIVAARNSASFRRRTGDMVFLSTRTLMLIISLAGKEAKIEFQKIRERTADWFTYMSSTRSRFFM